MDDWKVLPQEAFINASILMPWTDPVDGKTYEPGHDDDDIKDAPFVLVDFDGKALRLRVDSKNLPNACMGNLLVVAERVCGDTFHVHVVGNGKHSDSSVWKIPPDRFTDLKPGDAVLFSRRFLRTVFFLSKYTM